MAAVAEDISAIPVSQQTTEEAIENAIHEDLSLDAIAERFDADVTIDADTALDVETSDSIPKDSDTASNASSIRDMDFEDDYSPKTSPISHRRLPNGKAPTPSGSVKSDKQKASSLNGSMSEKRGKFGGSTGSNSNSDTASLSSKKSTRKNPLQMLKKLTKFDKPKHKSVYSSEFSSVAIDKLPQVFVAKYLGHRQISGVCGLHHVRKPVDEMVSAIKARIDDKSNIPVQNHEVELPLVYVVVGAKGLDVREHKSNKVPGAAPVGLMPIDFISYGVQDIKYWRVFTCIVVRELSSRSRTATCHAFLCDSAHSCRKMALSLGAAFSLYAKQLNADGKPHNFQVELRPPDELAEKLNAEFDA